MEFSDYIVYVDESGDHSLESINPEYPVFVLAFVIFHKQDYTRQIVPAIQQFKFKYFGHDILVLHEREIRKSEHPFHILQNPNIRQQFLADLSQLMDEAPLTLVASCIDKRKFLGKHGQDHNPYHYAMAFGLERVFYFLQEHGQKDRKTHLVFEMRGTREDEELELEFRRLLDSTQVKGMAPALDIVFADKKTNSAGLQLADMVARPIGRHLINPAQENRAYQVLQKKFRRNKNGEIQGWGLKCYP